MNEKHVVQPELHQDVSTFAILDKLSDMEDLLERKVDADNQEMTFARIEEAYLDLKEQLFESFYTSSDIEDIIVDTQHRHHDLVMRLYHEYMDEVSFLDGESIEHTPEESETYFYFNNSNDLKSLQDTFAGSGALFNRDLNEHNREPLTELHTGLNVSELFALENKIESLLALLRDLVDRHRISSKTIDSFLGVYSLSEYQEKLSYILSSHSLKQKKYSNKLSQIEEELGGYLHTKDLAGKAFAEDKYILKLKKKAVKAKQKILISFHDTHRDLDLLHERLYTFYHHLSESFVE